MTTIDVHELTKTFGENTVLQSVSLRFDEGNIYGLVGRNGSGKSILLKCIAGLVRPTSGTVRVMGKEIGHDADFAPDTGIFIEQPGLLVNRSAFENIRILASLTRKPVTSEINALIKTVGLDPGETKATRKYSMGMKQRLGIAMALLGDPKILLLDEPMSNLDQEGAGDMRILFQKLADEGKTLIIATHVQDDISGLCKTIFHLKNGIAINETKAVG